jgi:hypothetical protein
LKNHFLQNVPDVVVAVAAAVAAVAAVVNAEEVPD